MESTVTAQSKVEEEEEEEGAEVTPGKGAGLVERRAESWGHRW